MSKKKILIVEDEAIIGQTLKFMLEGLGYEVPAVIEEGEAVMEAYMHHSPDLVMMDIHLRGQMDGITAANMIRKQAISAPVIFLTAYSDDFTTSRARITEPYGYILKPFDEKELEICIEMAVYKHHMERRLFESEQKFQTTLRSITNPVITTDAAGKITLVNFLAERVLEKKLNELLNTSWSNHFEIKLSDMDAINEVAYDPLKEVMLQGISVKLPPHANLICHKDNSIINIGGSMISPVIDDYGQLLGTVIVLYSEDKFLIKN
jgi:CheY-like chemotaxis protein